MDKYKCKDKHLNIKWRIMNMSKRFRVILLVLLVVGGIFNFSHTVHAEDAIQWPIDIDATNFPDEGFRNYLLRQDFGVDDGKLSEAEMQNVKEIDISAKGITSLEGIEYFQKLEKLSCKDNILLTSFDISQNVNLQYLDCQSTGIIELDVSQNTNLQTLGCSFNQLKSLDVSKNINLEYLNCHGAWINKLDVRQNTKLKELACSSTVISELDVSQNTNLQILRCDSTVISELDVSKNANLHILSCDFTEISELDISQNTNLQTLSCSSTDRKSTRLNSSH